MKEAYVSFETSKLLKDKGFDGLCMSYYWTDGTPDYSEIPFSNKNLYEGQALRPTHQMVMAWLRNKRFEVVVIPVWQTSSKVYRSYVLSDLGNKYKDFSDSYSDNITYEEAVETALKYCLTDLI